MQTESIISKYIESKVDVAELKKPFKDPKEVEAIVRKEMMAGDFKI